MKVFITEDSPAMLERLIRLLKAIPNFELAGAAKTADESIKEITRLRPDVVTLDISLSSGTGFDVLRAVKQIHPPPLVIVLTVNDTPWHRARCRREGADYFFSKAGEFARVTEILTFWAAHRDDPGRAEIQAPSH